MNCMKCETNEATIHVLNQGDFCHLCHQELIEKLANEVGESQFPRFVACDDVAGEPHLFEISMTPSTSNIHWQAKEIDGGYCFSLLSKWPETWSQAYDQLIEKVKTGLSHKTIMNLSYYQPPVDTIAQDDFFLDVQPIGTVEILADDFNNPSLKIDGEIVDFADFGRGLTYYAEHNLHFQIRDPADDVLGGDTVLALVSIDQDVIYKRFEKTLSWFLEDNLLSEQRLAHCEEALFERLEDLRLLNHYGDLATASILGDRLKERLLTIKHTDAVFPAALLKRVDDLKRHRLAPERLLIQ